MACEYASGEAGDLDDLASECGVSNVLSLHVSDTHQIR